MVLSFLRILTFQLFMGDISVFTTLISIIEKTMVLWLFTEEYFVLNNFCLNMLDNYTNLIRNE